MPPPPASSKSYARLIFVYRSLLSHVESVAIRDPTHCARNIVGKAIDLVRCSVEFFGGGCKMRLVKLLPR